ncbi:glycosyltransferase family 4 protein [Synechococcus sp. W4D4]|uniref:glycosyltransferase family 4 protein n=1 Tax=Synechococcus sp. W4D4 TaxID=3392294 RepID=UPI0039EAA721
MAVTKRRLAALVTHPIQYFKPIFQGLAADPEVELLVVYGCDHGLEASADPDFGVTFAWDSNPIEGFPSSFASKAPLQALSSTSGAWPIARQAAAQIQAFQPDAVLVFSYSPRFIQFTTLLLAQAGQTLWLRAETTDHALERSGVKGFLRDRVLKRWYGLFRHVFPIGTRSQQHYVRLGIPLEKQSLARYAVDVDFFAAQVAEWKPQRQELRRDLQIQPGDHVLLYVGKISPVKNPLLLPQALAHLTADPRLNSILVVVVGDGELRAALEAELEAVIPGRWRGMGFQNQQQLGRFYALADTLVLPSIQGETWGLVVNEAQQFGLNVICSDKVGSSVDLVEPSERGRVHRSGDAADFAQAIAELCTSSALASPDMDQLPHPQQLVGQVLKQLKGLPENCG